MRGSGTHMLPEFGRPEGWLSAQLADEVRGRVLAVGDANVDIILPVSFYPERGGDVMGDAAEIRPGGSAANTAAALARAGIPSAVAACIGEDALGDYLMAGLAALRVDTTPVRRTERASTGVAFVALTPDGERTMFCARGASAYLGPEDITEDLIAEADVVHISGYAFLRSPQREAAERAVDISREMGKTVSLDPAEDPSVRIPEVLRGIISKVDILLPSRREAENLVREGLVGPSGPGAAAVPGGSPRNGDDSRDRRAGVPARECELAAALLAMGVRAVALKLGAAGCVVADHQGVWSIPAFPVTVRNTTGAGDNFNAGFLRGWLKGLGLRECAAIGNLYGAAWASGMTPLEVLKASAAPPR